MTYEEFLKNIDNDILKISTTRYFNLKGFRNLHPSLPKSRLIQFDIGFFQVRIIVGYGSGIVRTIPDECNLPLSKYSTLNCEIRPLPFRYNNPDLKSDTVKSMTDKLIKVVRKSTAFKNLNKDSNDGNVYYGLISIEDFYNLYNYLNKAKKHAIMM